ncbi:MAG TPA: glycerophosphodiester phosphodiesterase [Capsulimonadaceae bacterium]|jgi:glycerophosphoryl diester phosphodiesterase
MAIAKIYNRIAHHGAGALYAPGNTLDAVHIGIDAGCDMIEVDVRETQDHVLVLSHATARKIDNRDIPILRHTFGEWQELTGETDSVPLTSLEDVLLAAESRNVGLLLDLKDTGLENALARLIRRMQVDTSAIMVGVPSEPSRVVLRSLDPNIPIAHKIEPHETSGFKADIISQLATDAVFWPANLITKERVAKLKAKDIIVYAGPANTSQEMRRLRNECKVDGIITEFPDLLKTI